jgi:hypothetical protein
MACGNAELIERAGVPLALSGKVCFLARIHG